MRPGHDLPDLHHVDERRDGVELPVRHRPVAEGGPLRVQLRRKPICQPLAES